ncbi:MAG TPA: hypothetical protein VMU22_14890 [Rhizomicrobium sp.]|nr:hypothetical protein [Rhizomicrobium sp.]
MAKISVRHGVAQAYGLLFGRPLTVIGLTWLPAVFYAVAADFLIHRMDAAMASAVPSANGLFGQYAFFYFAALVAVTAFFGAVIAVPLTREAFGLREERVAVHLVVGAREARLFLALLRYYVIAVTALVALVVGTGIVISQATHYAAAHHFPATWGGYPLETWMNSVAGAITVITFAVLAVRYGFFLDAVAAVEDRARLRRAASLSKGNFWSIATMLVLVGLPAFLILLACEMTFGGLNLKSLGLAAAETTPFAGVLSAGLVVLHALVAGASAGAYAEMAEQVGQETDDIHYEPAHEAHVATTAAFAQGPSPFVAPAEMSYQGSSAHVAETEVVHAAAPAPMEIATPEAESVSAAAEEPLATAAAATVTEWMPPPPDAHFGADPHDAQPHEQHHEMDLHQAEPRPPADALAEAVIAAQAEHPVEAQNASAQAQHEIAHETAEESTSMVVSGATSAGQPIAMEASDVVPKHQASQVVGFDGHPVPDHAQTAEFPPPPLDPAGVLSAQSGFHVPPPG